MIRLRKRRWPTLRMMASSTKGAGGVSNPRQRQPDHLGHRVRNRLRQGKERQVHQLRDAHCPPPYMATAFTILRKLHGSNSRDGVVALIVEKNGRIISWGRKNPAVPCRHGETRAIMGLG